MLTIQGRVLEFPETQDTPVTIRVDLRHLLTRMRPYTRSYLRYHSDEFGVPDYGLMLCQQLRRIEGVSVVTITHYGCKVEIGSLYSPGEMKRKIRAAVEFTLASRLPWAVRRRDSLNWSYSFGDLLLTNNLCSIDLRQTPWLENNYVTSLGKQLIQSLRTEQGGVSCLYPHHLFMDIRGDDQDWPTLDAEFDALVAELIGTREVTIEWE